MLLVLDYSIIFAYNLKLNIMTKVIILGQEPKEKRS